LIETVDAAMVWPADRAGPERAYFFSGPQYWRYDPVHDWIERGYPKRIADEWPGLWPTDIDAALLWPRRVDGRRKAYFFRGSKYLRWDLEHGRDGDVTEISRGWPALPPGWAAGIDAACTFPDESVRFFRGAEYCVYDPGGDTVTQGPSPITARPEFSQLQGAHVDAAVLWPSVPANAGLPVLYLFAGRRYARIVFKRGDLLSGAKLLPVAEAGRLREVADGWNRTFQLSVWTASPDVPPLLCTDARLDGKSGGPVFPDGPSSGQGGWDLGINFSDFDDLLNKLEGEAPKHVSDGPIAPGEITRLGIIAHGGPGYFTINGEAAYLRYLDYWTSPTTKALGPLDFGLTVETLSAARPDVVKRIERLAARCASDAIVLLAGCEVAQGDTGVRFLRRLSQLLPGRYVVGFTTIGVILPERMNRKGAGCTEPGMRDSWNWWGGTQVEALRNREYAAAWDDQKKLPWVSPWSPHAVVARDGAVVQQVPRRN
jgi:matrix metalloproteinase-14 (membrane-inserted)